MFNDCMGSLWKILNKNIPLEGVPLSYLQLKSEDRQKMLTKKEVCINEEEKKKKNRGKVKFERRQVSHTCDFLSLCWLVNNVEERM